MAALRELFAKFDVDFDTSSLFHGAEAVEGLFGKLQHLGGLLVEGAIVGGLVHMVEKTVEAGRAMVITSEQVGISTDSLNLWQKGAALAGVEADDFTMSLRFMQRNAYEAATAGGAHAAAFKDLGVNVKDANGNLKDADTLLREMADGFQKTENPAKRVALAQQLLGRSGARLLPLFKNGTEGIAEMKAELEELGIGFDTSWTEKAEEAHREQTKLNMVLSSFRTKLAIGVLPIFTKFFTILVHYAGILNKAVKGTNAIQAALVVLGGVAAVVAAKILIAFAPLIISTLAWAAVIGLAVLAIDELITLFEGGDTILGRWIDDNYGAGTAAAWVQQAKDWWNDLIPALKDAWSWLSENILPTAKDVSDAFKALGQDIAFVIDQFRHLSEFKEGIAKIGHDIGVHLGLADQTDTEKRFAGGRDGIGDDPNPTRSKSNKRGGEGFFSDFSKFSGAPAAATAAPPGFIGPPAPPGMQIANNVTVQVAANAKPDPQLTAHIKNAVQEGLDHQNRQIVAGVQGS